MNKRNVILSVVALCWGTAVLVMHFAHATAAPAGGTSGSAYGAGSSAGLVFALVLGLAGACGLVMELHRRRKDRAPS